MPFQAYDSAPTTAPSTGDFQAYPGTTSPTDFHSMVTKVPDSQSFVSNFFAPIKSGIQNVDKIASSVGGDVKQAGQDIGQNFNDTISGKKPAFGAGFQAVGDVAKAAISPITETLNKGTSDVANTASDVPTVQNFANSKVGNALSSAANIPGEKYSQWAEQHPEAAKNLEALGNIAQAGTIVGGGEKAGNLAQEGLSKTAEVAKPVIEKVGNVATDITDKTVGKQALASELAKSETKATQNALEIIKPKLTPTEEASAKAQGRGTTKGIMGKVDIAPTTKEVEMGKIAQEAGVTSKNNFDANIKNMQDFQKASAEKIRSGLKQADIEKPLNFDKPQFKGQLGNVMNSVKKPITLVGDAAKIASNFKTAVMKLSDTVKPSREGMLDLRQGLDRLINEQLPGNIYTKDTPLGQYMRNTRRALNDYVESKIPDGKLPDGSSFKGELRKQHLLYDAIDNVSEKAPKIGSNRITQFIKNNPKTFNAIKYGTGTIGLEKILKGSGIPLP